MRYNASVREVEEAERWTVDERCWDILTEGRHQAQGRPPLVHEHLEELGRLHAAHEAAQGGDAGLRRRGRGIVDGGHFAENPGFPHREVQHRLHVYLHPQQGTESPVQRPRGQPQRPGSRAAGRCRCGSEQDQVLFRNRFDLLTCLHQIVAGPVGCVTGRHRLREVRDFLSLPARTVRVLPDNVQSVAWKGRQSAGNVFTRSDGMRGSFC